MRLRFRHLVLCALPGLLAPPALARDLFTGTFTVDGQTATAGSSNASDFADLFTNQGLTALFGTYTEVSAATADVSLRGVPAVLSYPAGSTALRLVIPSIGVDETFTGATRDESQDLALKWLRGAGGDAVTRFLRQAVATTPVDPMAGNPNSLMSQMGAADFGAALGGGGTGARFGERASAGRTSLGARFGSYSASGFDTDVYNLPLGHDFVLSNGMELLLDAPITLVDTNGAQSYSGSLGVGLRIPVALPYDGLRWTLTPILRFGGVGSVDAGAVGGMWSASITSVLDVRFDDVSTVTIGNMVGRLETLPIDVAGFNVSYDLANTMFRNGVIYTRSLGSWGGREVSGSAFLIDTRFTGDALYVRSYQEYGGYLSFGNPFRAPGEPAPLRAGFTLLSGEGGYRGFSLNFGISF
jgi:hypothetical protein